LPDRKIPAENLVRETTSRTLSSERCRHQEHPLCCRNTARLTKATFPAEWRLFGKTKSRHKSALETLSGQSSMLFPNIRNKKSLPEPRPALADVQTAFSKQAFQHPGDSPRESHFEARQIPW